MPSDIRTPFSDEVLTAALQTLEWAYAANADHCDPDLGHDEASFGFLLYKTVCHDLPGRLQSVAGASARLEDGSIVVRENGCSLRLYRIGASEFDDPWTSFPSNRGAAPAMALSNSMQLRLFPDIDGGARLPTGTEWLAPGFEFIVGHCGTALTGFRSAYLCLPAGVADDRVRQWRWLRSIYGIDVDGRPLSWPQEDGGVERIAAARIDAPRVKLRTEHDAGQSIND